MTRSNYQTNELIDLFNYGYLAYEIAELYGLSTNGVLYILKKYGVYQYRGKGWLPPIVEEWIHNDYVVNNKYSLELSAKYKVGVAKILSTVRKLGGTIKPQNTVRKYPYNESYFSSIDTHSKAYFLGFIAADGSLDDRSSGALKIVIQPNDSYILQQFCTELGIEKSPCINSKGYALLSVHGSTMRDCLRKHGIVQNKTHLLKFPTTIPSEFINSFLLGYFDGDGCFYTTDGRQAVVRFLGTKEFCTGVQNVLRQEGIHAPSVLATATACFDVSVHKRDHVAKLREYLYKDSNFCLSRKKDKYDRWAKSNGYL